jgi:hypothetical protein
MIEVKIFGTAAHIIKLHSIKASLERSIQNERMRWRWPISERQSVCMLHLRNHWTDFGKTFEIYTVVVMKNFIIQYTKPCRPEKITRRLGWSYCLYLHGENWSKQITSNKMARFLLLPGYFPSLFFNPQDVIICSSETSVKLYQCTRRHLPDDSTHYRLN